MKAKHGEAMKFDVGKRAYAIIPPEPIGEVADVFSFGATKYGDYNWLLGLEWSRLRSAAIRHLEADRMGKVYDEETGISHLAHAITNLVMLRHMQIHGAGEKDEVWSHKDGGVEYAKNLARASHPPVSEKRTGSVKTARGSSSIKRVARGKSKSRNKRKRLPPNARS